MKDPTLAGILSFLLPGLGHLYIGKSWSGIGLFILTFIGYAFYVIPGLIIHILVIIDSVKETKKINKQPVQINL